MFDFACCIPFYGSARIFQDVGVENLASSSAESIDFDGLEDHIDQLAKYVLNGREIRNTLMTGRQLSRFQKKPVTYNTLKHVLEVTNRFDTYLKDELNEGLDDNQVARETGTR